MRQYTATGTGQSQLIGQVPLSLVPKDLQDFVQEIVLGFCVVYITASLPVFDSCKMKG